MDIIIIVLILLGVVVIYFTTRFLSRVFKIITKILLLAVLILMVLTLLVIKDMDELKRGFIEQNNTFFLYDNNKLYSGIILKPMKTTDLSIDSFIYMNSDELQEAEAELNSKNYKNLLKNNYRLLIIKPEALNKPYTIKIGVELNQTELLEILMSNDAFKTTSEKAGIPYDLNNGLIKLGYEELYGSEEQFKGYLFAILLGNYLMKQKSNELVKNIRHEEIFVYPETMSFKIAKYLPWV